MNGLFVGVIVALCFSLVSTLKCVVGTAYGIDESVKRNDECDDAQFCVNYTYRASYGAAFHVRYGCSTGKDSISVEFFSGSPCKKSGCHKVLVDSQSNMPPDAKVCCCSEDFCNDVNGEVNECVKRARNRWRGRVAIINS